MSKHNLESLNPLKFTELIKNRETKIANASAENCVADFNANVLAQKLHPQKQILRVIGIKEEKDAKIYTLTAEECAYFTAGQYLSVYVNIDGKKYSRPYSIVSSPKDALEGFYVIAVKRVEGGIVSNYILDNLNVGDTVEVSDPTGNFTYEPLRDAGHIIAIAGGSGITPFVSLAKAISEGSEECTLTILYGSRKEEDILLKSELDNICRKCGKVKAVYVLSEEDKEGFEYGFINAEIIEKYAPESEYSVFLCGPQAMISFADRELPKLNIDKKYIRHEVHGEVADPKVFADYPENTPHTVNITVYVKGEKTEITASSQNTVLRILEDNGINPPSRCRGGECGFCHSKLLSGKVFIPKELDKRRQADSKFGFVHSCCSYPLSDLEIEVSES
ncbi:MAG: 2Fe-2S iron-sulfur cluster binding domain-containing protein [Clostridia bacterium]|nr:2Fe-2S iron-sulfur cluster binding domain-containing protein [Clostridia bacterium]